MGNSEKPRILIIEDDPDLRRILSIQLATEGYVIVLAEDGLAACDILQELIPDCIVMDLMMPRMDGFSFLKRLRSMNRTANIPAIVLTASHDQRHRRKSEQYLADIFLNKPYDVQQLIQAIDQLCRENTPTS
jgi:CheY-like chemotaxis protein